VGNIDVGKGTPTRTPGQPVIENSAPSELRIDGQNPPKKQGPRICGAMAQQGGRGDRSAPQKFVHLVGCRDSKARTGPAVRPRPAPAKR